MTGAAIIFLIIGLAYLVVPQQIQQLLSLLLKRPSASLPNKRGRRLWRLAGLGLAVASLLMLGGNWTGYQALAIPENVVVITSIGIAGVLTAALIGTLVVLLLHPQSWWRGQAALYQNPKKVAPSKTGLMVWRTFALLILIAAIFYVLRILSI